MYSSPPGHGAAIAALVLSDPQLLAEWKEELRGMAGRIQQMRTALLQALHQVGGVGKGWDTSCFCSAVLLVGVLVKQ
jgi:aspartate/tyrosine/aromatic aminotransferase